MEAFSALRAFVRGIDRSPVYSPHKGQWHGALMFSLICAWINDWVNNREAGDLRRHRGHYDAIVMLYMYMKRQFERKAVSAKITISKYTLYRGLRIKVIIIFTMK